MGRQQALQTQLDKALTELRSVHAENKHLTRENQSQQRSISHLKIALDERDNSLIQINNQFRVATSSLTLLNNEKKEWQDKFDSMQHRLNVAERRVRCLDHLTRRKLESRQEAGYGEPKRRGPFASIPASTDVIEAMRALNEEIYQTCVQFAENLERPAVFLTKKKPQVQVLGDHLTAMMEEQGEKATSDYNLLLMQTVLEVFMTHWCSSIIEAFYPQQESFADLLVRLSAQTTETSGT
jgi:DNA repair ATPase RecN